MRRVSWNLASCHATVQKLLVRQVLNKSKSRSWSATVGQCVINMCNHDAIESLSLSYRCHKQNTPRTSCGYHLYTDYLLWRNFLSPQCRNCSLITRLRLHMADPCTNFFVHDYFSSAGWGLQWLTYVSNLKSLCAAVTKIWMAVQM